MARPAIRMFLVRHGEVDANIEYRFLGRRDDPLNDTGIRQAEQLATLFSDVHVEVVYSSPLQRAYRTAQAISSAAGVEIRSVDELVELDFGDWEGLTRAQIKDADDQYGALLGRWDLDPSCAAPGGESLAAVQARVVGFSDRLLANQPGSTVAVVTHMGPIKALLCAALDLPLTGARRLFLDPATVSVVDWSSNPVIRLFNSHAHLGWRDARWLRSPPPGG